MKIHVQFSFSFSSLPCVIIVLLLHFITLSLTFDTATKDKGERRSRADLFVFDAIRWTKNPTENKSLDRWRFDLIDSFILNQSINSKKINLLKVTVSVHHEESSGLWTRLRTWFKTWNWTWLRTCLRKTPNKLSVQTTPGRFWTIPGVLINGT